jgi:transcriptional regulator with XRE-family HTH domain
LPGLSERDRESASLFVDEMRAMREQRGWSQSELADRAGYSESAVAMVETYQRPPTKTFARAMDKAFGTPGTFDRLERRLSNVPFPAAFRSFAPHEAEATALRMFEHSLVPGLLQAPDYAAAVLATKPNASGDVIEADVSNRLARQAVLSRQEPPMLWVLLDEGVLYRPVATPAVMHDQLIHLVELSRLPNITIQLVGYDAGGHSGLLGAFVIADRSAGGSIVFIEDVTGGRVSEDAATVAEVGLRFDALRSESLPKNGSRSMIERVAKERWKDQAP